MSALQPGWDALGGLVFVKIALTQGQEICTAKAGVAAGAAYGAVTLFCRGIVWLTAETTYCWSYT